MPVSSRPAKDLLRPSRIRLASIKAITDGDIDYTDIPASDASLWATAIFHKPKNDTKVAVSLRLEPEILEWFKGAKGGHTLRMAAVLKHYYEHNRYIK